MSETDPVTTLVDPDSLQLPHSVSVSLNCVDGFKVHLNQLFNQWLSLSETQKMVTVLLEEAKSGSPLVVSGSSESTDAGASSSPLLNVFPGGSTPPLSPRSFSGSPRSVARRHEPRLSSLRSLPKRSNDSVKEFIPQFYFHNGPPLPADVAEKCLKKLNEIFSAHIDGLHIEDFKPITKEICKLPSFFSTSLFRKLDLDNDGIVTRDQFVSYWIDNKMATVDSLTLVFKLLKHPDQNYLTKEDFIPVLEELVNTHPGLEFLQSTREFQERYAETTIYRIFYYINRSGNGHMTLRELKHGNLLPALQYADEEEDINKVLKYFSYEHFYVIYCKFWELDMDHDFLIDKEDLLRYGNHALTYRIVDRIFSQVPRKFTSNVEGKMGYEDFVYFILAEEDKLSEPSLEYWFKCVDLDCNGVLTANELQFFYEEQLHRMKCLTQEPVFFDDILCQIVDMIAPEEEWQCTLKDIKKSKLSGSVFNILFNLNKFMAFEARDPFLIRQEREEPTLTEWDRFARREYMKLSSAQDADDISSDSVEVWDENFEPPFGS